MAASLCLLSSVLWLLPSSILNLKSALCAPLASSFFNLESRRSRAVAVGPSDDLQAKIDGAAGGDVLLLATGTYRGFHIAHRHFTAARPLIIKAAPGARPLILGKDYAGYLGLLSDSSYLVFDGLTLENSNQPFYCTSIDHCLFLNLEIHNTGQEAIHLRGDSHDIDIRHCRIYDTGHYRDQ